MLEDPALGSAASRPCSFIRKKCTPDSEAIRPCTSLATAHPAQTHPKSARGLYPPAPKRAESAQQRTPAELYMVIKRGIYCGGRRNRALSLA
jgi:hypothetical protein